MAAMTAAGDGPVPPTETTFLVAPLKEAEAMVEESLRRYHGLQLTSVTTTTPSSANNESIVTVGDDEDDEPTERDSSDQSLSVWSYYRVLRRYPMYRAYFLSHLVMDVGDWFVGVANLLIIADWTSSSSFEDDGTTNDHNDNDGLVLGHLALALLLPKPIFSQVGGWLADRFDRRNLMIILDVLSGVELFGYLLAIQYRSIPLVHMSTMFRSALGATYYPVKTGILPMLITGGPNAPLDLQIAMTINSAVYGLCSIIGGLLAGSLVTLIGIPMCYVVDCLSFQLSAYIIWKGVRGNFRVVGGEGTAASSYRIESQNNDQKQEDEYPPSETSSVCCLSVCQLMYYLWYCGFAFLLCFNAASSFMSGFQNVLNAQYSTVYYDFTNQDGNHDNVNDVASSWNLGLIFSVSGLGYIVGPFLVNFVTNAHHAQTLLRACFIGLTCITVSWAMLAFINGPTTTTSLSFSWVLLSAGIRNMGTAIVSVNATLLWQLLTAPDYLGRVLALDFALATLSEAASAQWIGWLASSASTTSSPSQDKQGLAWVSTMASAFVLAAILILVAVYHYSNNKYKMGNSKQGPVVFSLVESSLPSDQTEEMDEDGRPPSKGRTHPLPSSTLV